LLLSFWFCRPGTIPRPARRHPSLPRELAAVLLGSAMLWDADDEHLLPVSGATMTAGHCRGENDG
jgi:hypothetical protein